MKIRKILGIEDPGLEDTLDMVLSERLAALRVLGTPEQKKRSDRKDRVVREMVRKHYPGDAAGCQKALDMIAMCESEETEDAYLWGIRDGIRFWKAVDRV